MKLSGKLAEKGLSPFVEEEFIVGSHKMPKIWIVVADSQKAHFFRKPDHHLEKIGESSSAEESGGHMQGSGSDGQSQLEASDEALNHGGHEFMKSLAEFLDKAAKVAAFDRLVLALAPKMLGTLRPQLSKDVCIRIVAELDKDLMHLDEKALYEYLNTALWV